MVGVAGRGGGGGGGGEYKDDASTIKEVQQYLVKAKLPRTPMRAI